MTTVEQKLEAIRNRFDHAHSQRRIAQRRIREAADIIDCENSIMPSYAELIGASQILTDAAYDLRSALQRLDTIAAEAKELQATQVYTHFMVLDPSEGPF